MREKVFIVIGVVSDIRFFDSKNVGCRIIGRRHICLYAFLYLTAVSSMTVEVL